MFAPRRKPIEIRICCGLVFVDETSSKMAIIEIEFISKLRFKKLAEHSVFSAFRLPCSISEAYLNHSYNAQLVNLPIYTAFYTSRTREHLITKFRIRIRKQAKLSANE